MKAVLISIRPKWCELIASGEKTVEVRKTAPKIKTPFKCYIYQTKMRWLYNLLRKVGLDNLADRLRIGLGKVIGEFVCDRIGYVRNYGDCVDSYDCIASCLSANEIIEYAKDKHGEFVYTYGWHISNLVIYDKPRELSEFYAEGECTVGKKCEKCAWLKFETETRAVCTLEEDYKPITRPPQSWCYVEEQK